MKVQDKNIPKLKQSTIEKHEVKENTLSPLAQGIHDYLVREKAKEMIANSMKWKMLEAIRANIDLQSPGIRLETLAASACASIAESEMKKLLEWMRIENVIIYDNGGFGSFAKNGIDKYFESADELISLFKESTK